MKFAQHSVWKKRNHLIYCDCSPWI